MLSNDKMNDDEMKSVNYDVMLSRESDAYIGQDINNTGSKIYFNMSWDELLTNITSDNNLYEYIKADKPCKMYFDFVWKL